MSTPPEQSGVPDEPQACKLLGTVRSVEVIAHGRQVVLRAALRKQYGGRNWRKMRGIARIEDEYGWIGNAEVHWFEAHGVGQVWWKIKRRLDEK